MVSVLAHYSKTAPTPFIYLFIYFNFRKSTFYTARVNHVSLNVFLSSLQSPTVCLLLLDIDFLGNKWVVYQQILSDKQPRQMADRSHSIVLLQNHFPILSFQFKTLSIVSTYSLITYFLHVSLLAVLKWVHTTAFGFFFAPPAGLNQQQLQGQLPG